MASMATIILISLLSLLIGGVIGYFLAVYNYNKGLKEQKELFSTQIESLKNEIKANTFSMVEEKAKELANANSAQINPVVSSLQSDVKELNRLISANRIEQAKESAGLKELIKNVTEHSLQIGEKAEALTHALTGNNKMQGNYGETILSNVLNAAGLIKGKDYHEQVTISAENENGAKESLKPDIIVHIPDNNVIIDSKVSLKSYIDWINAKTETEKEIALKELNSSVETHIRTLAQKQYHKVYKNLGHPVVDYTIMFIPNEGALHLILEQNETLWHNAYEKGVIITGRLSLFSMLRMIQTVWSHVKQEQNIQEILKYTSTLMDRIFEFNKRMNTLKESIDKCQRNFNDAQNKLTDGKQSVEATIKKLQTLGTKIK